MAEEVIVRSKEKRYRGQTLEHLKSLGVRECAKYLSARSRRSVLRNFDVVDNFVKSCEKKIKRNKRIRTHLRDMIIVPKLVGMTMCIHTGRGFQDVNITIEMIGNRLEEFAQTRILARQNWANR